MKSFIQTRDIDEPKKIGLVTKMYLKCLTTTTLIIIVSHAKDDNKKTKKKKPKYDQTAVIIKTRGYED